MPGLAFLLVLVFLAAWVGHAYVWTGLLNYLYAQPLPRWFLKPWRYFSGLVILAFPLLTGFDLDAFESPHLPNGALGWAALGYTAVCLVFGVGVFPAVTVYRLVRKPPAALVAETTQTLDLRAELGDAVLGRGKWVWAARLPVNCIFRVDFTELTLALPDLPPAWDGLTILLLSDLHFRNTPGRPFFDRVMSEVQTRWPVSDLVCLAGDYIDIDDRAGWIGPLLGPLAAREARLAILGNHDKIHHPERVRKELAAAGYTVLSNAPGDPACGPRVVSIRGVPCLVVGHEGPWLRPEPVVPAAPDAAYRLCLSHTPDYFYWGQAHRFGLMLCGHVHGGQIRVPVVGSIFVPSTYGRRFDMGVFEGGGTVMVTGRGLSGKEPLRFRCHPQVIRITLKCAGAGVNLKEGE